ncbi:response regulator [Acidaminobacter sp. JC074]|uniref:response regulator n=1 Tax=Acidaminobacter sp. JC074 TaxID=2530199 RepID=UPI001F11205E|nr:response regulator [Acidaminobacter sp. JC074]
MRVKEILVNLRVLFVEDDLITQSITKEMIKELVGKVYVASNGKEALEKFEKYQPDIVITDLRMPEIDGFGVIEHIRRSGSECGIVVCTEVNDVNEILKSTNLGIDKYIVKPMTKQSIVNSLNILAYRMMNRGYSGKIARVAIHDKEFKESRLKAIMQRFTKYVVGKGPSDIHVFINGSRIEVKNFDVLTPIELKTIKLERNSNLVEFMRSTLYQGYVDEVIEDMRGVLGMPLVLDNYEIDIDKSVETFVFTMSLAKKKVL